MENISLPSAAVLQSQLKDLKSIVLSLEWEINDQILEQFEGEVNKLYLFYTGDRILQGLLRILRFVGRYVRVRGASSNQGSINLLMSVYDHLEAVMVSEGMTEANKHIFLMESIKQYQSWVESADIDSPVEMQAPETPVDEVKPLEMESSEGNIHEEQKEEVADIQVAEEKTFAEAVIDKPAGDELSVREVAGEDKIEWGSKEQGSPVQTQPASIDEMPPPAHNEDEEKLIAAMKDLPTHEAFAYALDELKKTFQTEIDALKEEIRRLKNTG